MQAAKTKASGKGSFLRRSLPPPLLTDCAVGVFIVAYGAMRVNLAEQGGRGGIGIRGRFGICWLLISRNL